MAFSETNLPSVLKAELRDFAKLFDFIQLYKEYSWEEDTWENGFPNILKLEEEIAGAAQSNRLRREHVFSVARWGKLRNLGRVKCLAILALPLCENGLPHSGLEKDPAMPMRALIALRLEGIGPTYLSKILRFALPLECGAIDTRIVRVIGKGDFTSKNCEWLDLRVRNDGYGWYIPKHQPAWPTEYSKWINILRFLARRLDDSGEFCPHPEGFLTHGLRQSNSWACADVEMALFSYASKHLVRSGVQ